jgi:type I site-specific deoxyribonuclease, HsdR family
MTDESQIQIDEYTLVEEPAINILRHLGYTYIDGHHIDKEPHHFFLFDMLRDKLKELNPWIDDINLNKVIRDITLVQATSSLEANESLYYKLVNYISTKQDLGHGKKGQTVKIIDFDNPESNEFTVINQFYIKGSDFNIIPDIVVFVNGIPIAVIECKSPNIESPIDDAIDQLFGYKEKNEQFFYPNQILVALARYQARYASTFSPAKYFFEWKVPYPLTESELKAEFNKENLTSQDILLYSLFNKENLLDIIRSYIVFEKEDNNTYKKLCRYNQYIASRKILNRITEGKGGIIWHTQGSGKSLTMTYTALKLRRIERIPQNSIENPCILIVTDRTDLDDQISGTFTNCKFPNPVQAEGVEHLKEELQNPQGKTLFANIQKFQTNKGETYPELSKSSNIIVFVDEAHRSQYKDLALNMRTAIPNAIFIGFTGTPIDNKDKSTIKVFGTYIDKYLPKQSIADGATVQIKYQARLPQVHVISSELDMKFDDEFSDYTDEEQEFIKQRYGNYKTISEEEKRIKEICTDLLEHYNTAIRPEGFKAQIVTYSRDAAVIYKRILDDMGAPESEVIFSANNKDAPNSELRKHYKSKAQQRNIIKRFRKPFDDENNLTFIIVCNKLLTGFDAPIEQVMYLDKPLREHNLMQAVARVNRPFTENKNHGLIIDYCGISKKLKEALEIFNDGDIAGYMESLLDDVAHAEQALNKVKRFFKDVPTTYDSAEYVDNCVIGVLNALDTRIRFEKAFKEFAAYVNNIIPNPEANQFKRDLYFYGKIYNTMRTNYDGNKVSVLDAAPKVKKLIHEYLVSNGIKVMHEPISIYSTEFYDIVNQKTSDRAKASLIEHKIRTTISNLLATNPIYYTSLRERLDKIIKSHEEDMESSTTLIDDLNKIKDALDVEKVAQQHNMRSEEFAIYQMIRTGYIQMKAGTDSYQMIIPPDVDDKLTDVAKDVFSKLDDLAVIDWKHKQDQQKKMLQKVKRALYKLGYDVDTADRESKKIVNLARNIL